VLKESQQVQDDVILRIMPQRIVIADVDPAHPYLPPKPHYTARALALYGQKDMAILKIDRDLATDKPVNRSDFPTAPLGNAYDMVPGRDEFTTVGYPGKGGAGVTLSKGLFMGYQFEGRAPDGSLNSSVTIGPGNSGGAALFDGKLVAVPTAVSTDVGSDFGYLNPITWSARPLAYAALRFNQTVPALNPTWLRNEYNRDVASKQAFIGGRIKSASTMAGIPEATVIVRRPDRTLEQILALNQEVSTVMLTAEVQKALQEGADPEEIAEQLKMTPNDVKEMARQQFDEKSLSADARAMLHGEFFYSATTSEKDGFFFLAAPYGRQFVVAVGAQGYRNGSYNLTVKNDSYASAGDLKLYRP